MGDRTFANVGPVAPDVPPVSVGPDCRSGPDVQLPAPIHPAEPDPRRARWARAPSTTPGDDAWSGGGAIVPAAVTVGADTVVGAGAVASRDLPAVVPAVGNPAGVARSL